MPIYKSSSHPVYWGQTILFYHRQFVLDRNKRRQTVSWFPACRDSSLRRMRAKSWVEGTIGKLSTLPSSSFILFQ